LVCRRELQHAHARIASFNYAFRRDDDAIKLGVNISLSH
jgi:hypothetical protein